MTLRDWIQAMSFILAVYCFIGLLIWSLRVDMRRRWAFPALTWILHTIVFYATQFVVLRYNIAHTLSFTDWSSILRLHTYVIAGFIISMLLVLNGKLDGHNDRTNIS
jgi:hypothetical protein